jgi:glycosyltransferase involved in cell wall biosynthesis
MATPPVVTVAVPSHNQGEYLDETLRSIFEQDVPVEVVVVDGGSTDGSLDIIRRWETRLHAWRSHPDSGQASAINEGIAKGRAPYVCWLNSDDFLLPNGLSCLVRSLESNPLWPAAYGRAWNYVQKTSVKRAVWVEPFDERRLALRCIIAQPGSLIRRSAWEALGGLDEGLHMAMDYDLWWRLFRKFGPLGFVDQYVAVNREHPDTKTKTKRRRHYSEAIQVVRRHYGRVPMKWWLAQPYAVWFKAVVR